jgi:uncharacterized protein YkwD
MKNLIVTLIFVIFAIPSIAQTQKTNFKKVFTQSEKMIFLDSINKYRIKGGIAPLQYLSDAERFANVRLETIYNHLNDINVSVNHKQFRNNHLFHLHYGLLEDAFYFNETLRNNRKKNYIMITPSECIALFFQDEENMLHSLFNGWKNSPSHWNGMMDESYDTVALEMKKTNQGIIACLVLFEKFNK